MAREASITLRVLPEIKDVVASRADRHGHTLSAWIERLMIDDAKQEQGFNMPEPKPRKPRSKTA